MSEKKGQDLLAEQTRAHKKQVYAAAEKEVRDRYRRVFSGPHGNWVLTHMLVELGHFDTVSGSEAEVARQNYAKRILKHLGVLSAPQVENIVRGLMSMPLE